MIILGIVEFGLSMYAFSYLFTDYHDSNNSAFFWVTGMSLDFCASFALRLIAYFLLARNWEGYQHECGLKTCHYLTYMILTCIPYFDFLLHLGYKNIGTAKDRSSLLEEPYPYDFRLPKK